MTSAPASGQVPKLPRGVKLRFDQTRGKWFLLGPERVFEPDEIAIEILQRVDGKRSLDAITVELCDVFQASAEEIGPDVVEFVEKLVAIRMLELINEAT